MAQSILPQLDISQQNITHYASLVHHYTIYDLERFDDEQTYLYLLCYALKRYQQVNDNLVEALDFNVKKLEKETQEKAKGASASDQGNHDKQVGQLILLFVDDDIKDVIHQKAFSILPKESIRALDEKMIKKQQSRQDLQWSARDAYAFRYRQIIRPLMMKIDFESALPNNPLLQAIQWMKEVFTKKKTLSQKPFNTFPLELISKRLKHHLLEEKTNNEVHANRFEIPVYRQISKQMATGALFVKDSLRHRPFAHDLVSLKEKKAVFPWTSYDSSMERQPFYRLSPLCNPAIKSKPSMRKILSPF